MAVDEAVYHDATDEAMSDTNGGQSPETKRSK
jgi:hypothetical protein